MLGDFEAMGMQEMIVNTTDKCSDIATRQFMIDRLDLSYYFIGLWGGTHGKGR